ncbi:MAG: hypothetical protein NG747_00390 [Candidatus Brocadia sp.]|nr:hypothetical protein [Candidatus Brocadia sp.]
MNNEKVNKKSRIHMQKHKSKGYILSILWSSVFPLILLSCGSDRINIEFKTSKEIYVDDSKTDPDKLNKELEYDIRAAEKKRLQKQRETEAAAKAEAERKAKAAQDEQERMTGGETTQLSETEQQAPQQ